MPTQATEPYLEELRLQGSDREHKEVIRAIKSALLQEEVTIVATVAGAAAGSRISFATVVEVTVIRTPNCVRLSVETSEGTEMFDDPAVRIQNGTVIVSSALLNGFSCVFVPVG